MRKVPCRAVTPPQQLRAAFARVQTERLLLRAVTGDDVDAAFAIHSNVATYAFHPDGVTRTRAQSAAQIEGWQQEWQRLGFGFWAVSRREHPRVIGFGGLSLRELRERPVLNTYYRFEPDAWGNGYATEMAARAVALARRLLPQLPIVVRTRPQNVAARAVAEKLGLLRAPALDDQLLTYVSEWEPGEPAG